ncbi:MAG TPA: thiamine phosphate synthase [Hyphomicrobiaceae bacterium]|nr:thiamine phosphate synthase [Hyphomicrobiaceae bacterium]
MSRQSAAHAGLAVFYPIVPDAAWLARLAALGVKTIQLRVKDAAPDVVAREIAASLDICRRRRCQLIVNDHWRAALAAGADFVHLGQEDLAAADVAALKAAGVRLGISTHHPEELAIALAAQPDYVALGPIYETRLKVMKWAPHGLDRIADWRRRIGVLPLVAIGGLTPERADAVLGAGADSLAVVTDFITHPDPEARVRQWLDLTRRYVA